MLILESIMESFNKMNYEKDFDMIDAFMALRDLDDDSVADMIKPKRSGRKLHEGKGYPLHGSKESLEAAREFLNENDEIALEVIDPDADSLEHVKDRIDYVGQMILRCNRCQANKFIDMDALVEDSEEEDVYNTDDECPNCKTSGIGYEIIGQVGKYEEPKAEEETAADETAEDQEDAVETEVDSEGAEDSDSELPELDNDEASDELKFDNDDASDEIAAEEIEPASDTVEEISDVSDEIEEPDMMETSTSEDDEDDIDVEEDEDTDDEEVKESLYRPALYEDAAKYAANKKEALMYDKIMDCMGTKTNVYDDYWKPFYAKYESKLDALETPDIRALEDHFEELYTKYHNEGIVSAPSDVLNACSRYDKEYGLAKIENHRMYVESTPVLENTTISEVLGSLLDADKVGRIEITNSCDEKKDEKVYDGDYNNLPLNLANAACTRFDVNNRTLACNIDQDEQHGRRPLADILDKFGDENSDNIHLYDIASSDEIFKGKKRDAIEKYGKCGFISIDTPAVIRMTICDPSIVTRVADSDKSAEDALVEHIITENNLSITRLDAPYSNEFWIRESIKEREDLDLIYEAYVKPLGSELMSEFKNVTGYYNALDEAFEAGYKAASEKVESETIDEAFDYAKDDETFELEWFRAAMLNSDGDIVLEDFATVIRHVDGSFTVDGEILFSDGHKNIVDALVDAIETIPDAEIYDDIEISLEADLAEFVSDADKAALGARLDCIVEELDEEPAEVREGFLSRMQLIAELEGLGKKYYFDRYTDAQLYRILQKERSKVAKEAAEAEIAPPATCENCGMRLNDGGTCPACDDGEVDFAEAFDYAELYDKIQAVEQDNLEEGLIGSLLFNSSFAHELYDEFYKPLADAIKANDKAEAMRLYNEYADDLKEVEGKKYAATFVDVQKTRLANYLMEIEAIDVSEPAAALTESVDLTLSQIVKDSINHMISDLGYDADDEEFPDAVLSDIEDNYDVEAPTEPRAYAAWASEVFAEITRQLNNVTEDLDDEFIDWVDEPVAEVEEEPAMQIDDLPGLVEAEMPSAMREWGTSISKLANHFLTIMEEAGFAKPDTSELKSLIATYLENRSDEPVGENFTSYKSRKDLAEAITECKNNSRPYTVRRSVKEGYRYDLILEADESEETISDAEVDAHEEEIKNYSKDNKEEISKAAGAEVMDKLSDASSYTEFVKILNKDRKSKAFLQYLRQHYKTGDDEIETVKASGASTALVECSKLIPTQQNISLDKSLGMIKPGKSGWAVNIINNPATAFNDPTITYAGKYIIDGHHRWSKAYALVGPAAKIKVINFPAIEGVTWKDMLKAAQLAIVAKNPGGDLIHKVGNDNMLADTSGQAAADYYIEHADEKVVEAMKAKGFGDDKEAQGEHVKKNVAVMASTGVVSGAAPRAVMPQTDTAPGSVDLLKKAVIDLTEGDNLPVPAEEAPLALTAEESEVNAKIMRISQDISQAISDVYGIEADPALIVADIVQDLGLISGDIKPEDLEDTALNRATIEMYQDHEAFWIFMDTLVTALTGQSLNMTPEAKIKRAIKTLSGPNFSTPAIRKGIESTQFQRLAAQGRVPFIPAGTTPLLAEDIDDGIEINTEKFDSELNEYFNEAYDETVLYATTSGTVNEDGSIKLEGSLMTEAASSDVVFTLTPETVLEESLGTNAKEVLEDLTYTVTNNISEEVFTFRFKD